MKKTIYEQITPLLEQRGLDVVQMGNRFYLKIRDKSAMMARNVHKKDFIAGKNWQHIFKIHLQ